ncbi:MAG: hypothetical protein WBD34_13410 [Burkholderiaceae bacterium]
MSALPQSLITALRGSVLALIFLLSGCGTNKYAESIAPERPIELNSSGVLLTRVNTHIYASGGAIFIRKSGAENSLVISAHGIDPLPKWDRVKGIKGRLFAIGLPPGEYELHYWYLLAYADQYGSRAFYPPPTRATHPFSIRAGEVTYLGHYTIQAVTSLRGPYNQPRSPFQPRPPFFGAYAIVANDLGKDTAQFHRDYPDLRELAIQPAVPDPAIWQGLKAVTEPFWW